MTTTSEVLDHIDQAVAGVSPDPEVPEVSPQAASRRRAVREHQPPEFVDVSRRTLPWAGLVTGAAEPGETLTSQELLVRAGLNWGVGLRPLYRKMNDGSFQPHPRSRETYNLSDESPLGEVKGHYEPYSNEEVFAFGDSIVADGKGRWVHAGQQAAPDPGSRVFMTMLLKEFTVLGNDLQQLYLFLRASHDGSTGLNAWLVPFAVRCLNQQAMVNAAHLGHWTILHTRNIGERVEEARHSLSEAVDYEAEYRRITEKLAATTVSEQKVRAVLNRVVPEGRAKRDDMIADMRHLLKTSSTISDEYRPTAYGLLLAVTEYYDHIKPARSDNARFMSVMEGEGAKARSQALKALAGLN